MPEPRTRALLAVALPTEHGGWSITLEPVVLGLLVAPTGAGFALGAAAFAAFLARTPLKVVLVDRWRGRRLERTRLARWVLLVEMAALVFLVGIAVANTEAPFWWPLLLAAPLVVVELWHDMRSRSRRLVPELAGAVGIGSVAAAIALAGGESDGVAAALWVAMAARSIAAIPFVRVQLARFKGQDHHIWHSDTAQAAAVAVVLSGRLLGEVPTAAVAAIVALAAFEVVAVRLPPRPAALLGAQQVVLGLTVVLITGLAVRAP
jgi:hypothetical protein